MSFVYRNWYLVRLSHGLSVVFYGQYDWPVLGYMYLKTGVVAICSRALCTYFAVKSIFVIYLRYLALQYGLGLWCLTPLSTIFQLYRRSQLYFWIKPKYPGKTTDLSMSLTHFNTYYCIEYTSPYFNVTKMYIWKKYSFWLFYFMNI